LTSLQSSVAGSVTVASFAGLTSVGAAGVVGWLAGVTVSVALRLVLPYVAVIVTGVEVATVVVVIENVALCAPA